MSLIVFNVAHVSEMSLIVFNVAHVSEMSLIVFNVAHVSEMSLRCPFLITVRFSLTFIVL